MTFKNLLNKLPKYKKTWVKERTNTGYSDSLKEVYLVVEKHDSTRHNGEIKIHRLSQYSSANYPCEDMYFFELFKYLRKWQMFHNNEETRIYKYANFIKDPDLKKEIKKHLLIKHSKQLSKNKLLLLPEYSELIDYCFNELLKYNEVKITLVIQKKLGYKYYENITYK